jgi:hypothetical protein
MYDNEMSQDEINESIAQGLGSLCWWSLTDTLITPTDLRAAMNAQGLDASEVPAIKATTAIARAAREFKSGRKGRDAKRYRAEVVYKDTTRIEVQIQYHSKDENGRTSWLPHEKVSYDVGTTQWDCAGSTKEAESFREIANKRMCFYDHVWIRGWLQNYMDALNGFRVGSNFYTPTDQTSAVESVKQMVRSIGNSEFWIVNVLNDGDTHETVVNGARNNIEGTLDGMLEKLTNWERQTSGDRKIREDSASQTLADFAALRARADLYAASLQVSLDDLTTAIDSATTRAQDLIDGVPVPTPEPEAERHEGLDPAILAEQRATGAAEAAPGESDEVSEAVANVKKGMAFAAEFTAALDEIVEERKADEDNGVTVEPVIEPVTVSEVDALRAEFKAQTGKEAPEITDIEALRGLVAIVKGAF